MITITKIEIPRLRCHGNFVENHFKAMAKYDKENRSESFSSKTPRNVREGFCQAVEASFTIRKTGEEWVRVPKLNALGLG
ncbi:hypothetical protein HZH66_007094 [Vespula vulgaris]|uniref:Uncharacterized protein n=1 Tax=Vespula vulgaris TaxID=7454 RepID=A0A834JXG8_VESVU|nr:hypothetical protein HZH66_007094 [Vespula vulgaris]